MTDPLKKLKKIAESLENINIQMNKEAKVQEEELADRIKLGLTGDAAIEHYNKWMDQHNISHLKIED